MSASHVPLRKATVVEGNQFGHAAVHGLGVSESEQSFSARQVLDIVARNPLVAIERLQCKVHELLHFLQQ